MRNRRQPIQIFFVMVTEVVKFIRSMVIFSRIYVSDVLSVTIMHFLQIADSENWTQYKMKLTDGDNNPTLNYYATGQQNWRALECVMILFENQFL